MTWGPESQKEHFSIAAYKLSSVKISDLFPRWVPLLYPKVGALFTYLYRIVLAKQEVLGLGQSAGPTPPVGRGGVVSGRIS